MFGKDKLKFVGYDKFEVVPDGDSYKATLSGVKVMPNEPDAPKIGDVTFNVMPKDADKYSISNLMLPSGVDIVLADGQGKARLEIGSQQFSGVWSKAFAGFLDTDAVYKDVTLTSDQGVKFAIGEATLKQTSIEKSAGIYDQTGNFALKNITVGTPEGSATIATITSTGDAKGTNLADLAKFRDQFNALLQKDNLAALRVAANSAKILAAKLQQADRCIGQFVQRSILIGVVPLHRPVQRAHPLASSGSWDLPSTSDSSVENPKPDTVEPCGRATIDVSLQKIERLLLTHASCVKCCGS
ncbi:MAG: hypothetical protein HC794_03330 [Nitrospiraceae bacterium]|nr:hypothetical protein [Nitrospiraceae bacterium]